MDDLTAPDTEPAPFTLVRPFVILSASALPNGAEGKEPASGSRVSAVGGDRSSRARGMADAFADRFRPTLPPPDPDAIPRAGRHVRLTAETHTHVYVGGEVYHRDARARITARATGMPAGWSVRLVIADVQVVSVTPSNPGSRADPAVLRAHRKFADPSAAASLSAPLRNTFPGRPIQTDTHSLFSSSGLVFVREASVVLPLNEGADDQVLLRSICAAAQASLIGARHADLDGATRAAEPTPAPLQRGHLRIIQ